MKKRQGLSFYQKKKKINKNAVKTVLGWIFSVCVTGFIAGVFVYAFGLSTSMVGTSMEPNINNGQLVCINRYAYLLKKPQTGDVVAFLPNGNKKSHYSIKRVVAKGGDMVEIKNGKLYVNQLEAAYEFDMIADAGIAEYPVKLGLNQYFLMGDNCNFSEDSRSANIGVVEGKDIVGKVWLSLPDKNGKFSMIH